jgi:hypothetical protein
VSIQALSSHFSFVTVCYPIPSKSVTLLDSGDQLVGSDRSSEESLCLLMGLSFAAPSKDGLKRYLES